MDSVAEKPEIREEIVFLPNIVFPFEIRFTMGSTQSISRHLHASEIEMHYFRKGEGHYFVNNDIYRIEPHTLLIIHKNEIHRYVPPQDGKSVYKITLFLTRSVFNEVPLGIMKEIVNGLINCRQDAQHLIRLSRTEAVAVEMVLDLIAREWEDRYDDFERSITNNLINLFILLKRASSRKCPQLPVDRVPVFLKRLLDYMDENYMNHITLADVAASLSYSPFYISHIFKTYTGFSFREYLNQRRIQEARDMLDGSSLSATRIAAEIGFSSIDAFNRNFKNLVKMTPMQYRKFSEDYRNKQED